MRFYLTADISYSYEELCLRFLDIFVGYSGLDTLTGDDAAETIQEILQNGYTILDSENLFSNEIVKFKDSEIFFIYTEEEFYNGLYSDEDFIVGANVTEENKAGWLTLLRKSFSSFLTPEWSKYAIDIIQARGYAIISGKYINDDTILCLQMNGFHVSIKNEQKPSEFTKDSIHIQNMLNECIELLNKHDCSPLACDLSKIMGKLQKEQQLPETNNRIENNLFKI